MDYRRTFRTAAVSFVDLAARLPAGRWAGPGLGDWSLGELVGHGASSGLRQVPAVLAAPAASVAVETAEAYFALARSVPAEVYAAAQVASAADARATAELLGGSGGRASLGELAGRATAALAAVADEDVVETPGGGMRVRDWIPTRTFELVVHALDIAAAAEVEAALPPELIVEATGLAVRLAAVYGDGPAVLRALTGRAPLAEKFSVV